MTPNDWAKCMADSLTDLEQQFAWATNAPLKGFNCYKTEGGWLLVIKTASVQRGALVAFYGGATVGDCVDQLVYDMFHEPGIRWKGDKYPK
jgi:hypothetical protein